MCGAPGGSGDGGRRPRGLPLAVLGILLAAHALPSAAAEEDPATAITIQRTTAAIKVDGVLDEAAWQSADRVESWWETRPGDNIEPAVKNLAYLTYDGQYLYIAFDFEDPEPGRIRAPLGDRDDDPTNSDHAGVVILPGSQRSIAQEFVVNPRGIQWDGIISDNTGEDATPDFYWESAARINEHGWSAELRIPFSTLRYSGSDPGPWRILMYRNHPREYRRGYYTSRMPRERNCYLCNARPLVGLSDLPTGSHWIVAPYAAASRSWAPDSRPGTRLGGSDETADVGLDAKWVPNPNLAVDATVNPDFSQVESDAAQITTNERFALFWPEKRPFFMEGADLFTTPLQAIYTRTLTSPRWGARATGTAGDTRYTLLVAQDEGGGSVILPGPYGSQLADQDFRSTVALGRVRYDIKRSFASFVFTDRQIEGGGFNRVIGPDFEIRPNDRDVLVGQYLLSWTEDPRTRDPNDVWDGAEQSGGAGELYWQRSTGKWDSVLLYKEISDQFRADEGFVPSAGYRARYGEIGRTFRPTSGPITRLRLFAQGESKAGYGGDLIYRQISPGFGLDSRWGSFVRFEFNFDDVNTGTRTFRRNQIIPTMTISPGRRVPQITFHGTFGDEVDFANDRLGKGGTMSLGTELRPTDHLLLSTAMSRRWLDVDAEDGVGGRLFTADVARLRAMYLFTDRIWLRLIGEWVETKRNQALYTDSVPRRSGGLSSSALFAFKLNWQTVAYLGYVDSREIDPEEELERSGRRIFFKVSYAFRG